MSKKQEPIKNEDLGFQIAPMIDVIFLLILYFMVKVGDRQVEMEIRTKLPGSAETSTSTPTESIEETVTIDDAGVIAHNDEALEAGGKDGDLAELKNRMARLAEQGKQMNSEVIVTVSTHPDTKYSRVTDVLNTLQFANIKNMTFSVQEE